MTDGGFAAVAAGGSAAVTDRGSDAGALNRPRVAAAVARLGLAGRPLCLHTSLRSFGPIDGGAEALAAGILDTGATLLVPTSTFRHCMAPKPAGLAARAFNAEDDGSLPQTPPPHGFHPDETFVDPAMGAFPAAVLHLPGRVRGAHPLTSFTAVGPLAEQLVAGQTPTDVFAPLHTLTELGGAVVCAGVDLTATTLLHLAEERAGLRLLHRWGMLRDGSVVEAVHGGCSRGFERLAPGVAPAMTPATVGRSAWRIYDGTELLALATASFAADAAAGLCSNADCARCRDQLGYAGARALTRRGA